MIDKLNAYDDETRQSIGYLLDWLELAKHYRKDGESGLMKLIEQNHSHDYLVMDKYKIFYQYVEDRV